MTDYQFGRFTLMQTLDFVQTKSSTTVELSRILVYGLIFSIFQANPKYMYL